MALDQLHAGHVGEPVAQVDHIFKRNPPLLLRCEAVEALRALAVDGEDARNKNCVFAV